jgi:CMP-N-acetylneuraminic acid synthetase
MLDNKTFLAIIPARGGSKRLPRKNLLPLGGKPLVVWSIECAKNSEYIDEIILSSDNEEVLKIGKNNGINSLERPIYLATDTAKTEDVVLYHLEKLKNKPSYIILLQPTSPLRTSLHIDEAIKLLNDKKADAVISVCEIDHPIEWTNILPENMSLEKFILPENMRKRSQDFSKRYRINGAIYIVNTDKFLEEKTFFIKKNIYAYVMDKIHSVDIDEKIDFFIAESILLEKLEKYSTC